MNIKRISLLTVSATLLASGFILLNEAPKENYFPRENKISAEQRLFQGHAEYLNAIRNNRTTGFVSNKEVNDALLHADKMKKADKALDITWRFKGPDNVGGRTRALVIDRNDTLHILAGAMSGGLWESFNGAVTWQPYDPDFKILNVSSITQSTDGTFYVGTGARLFERASNNNASRSSSSGTGLYKLTGNGNSDLLIGPVTDFSFNPDWSSVYELAADPTDPLRIFAATNRGLRVSTDGGLNWTNANTNNAGECLDVQITSDGKIYAAHSNIIYVSTDNGATFSSTTYSSAKRIEIAIAPSNSDIAYAAMANGNNCLLGVYRTYDAGTTWAKLENTPDYFNNGLGCQGDYDNAIAVYPDNPGKILVGGIGLWQWNQSSADPAPVQGEWKSIATTNLFFGPFSYVHADKHKFVFHPTNSNKLYIASDGGVGYSENMNSPRPNYGQNNLGYNVTQFYDIGVGPKDLVIGGTQDNGTQLMGLGFNTGKSAVEVQGGDGFDAELFTIDPSLGIASLYYGNISRVQGIGTSLASSNFSNALITSGRLDQLCNGTDGSPIPGCSPLFYTNFAIWESFNHQVTTDSVIVQIEEKALPPLKAGRVISYASKNNNLPLTDTLDSDIAARDTLRGDVDTFKIGVDTSGIASFISAYDTITVDTNNKTINFRYRGKAAETKNYTVGTPVSYTNVFFPSNLSVTVRQEAGEELEIFYMEPQITFYYLFELPDIIQSMVALTNVRGGSGESQRDIWMSRDVLKGGNVNEPRWVKISGLSSTPQPSPSNSNTVASAFTNDGNHLFYGTLQGNLYRIDNLNAVDFSQIPITASEDFTVNNTTSHRLIKSFGSRAVTGIAIDPNNSDNVIVTLGNYGGAQYVQRSTNATGVVVDFVSLSGEGTNALPNVPVYEAIIDRKDNNKVLLATEIGVFGTDNAFDTATVVSQLTGVRVPDVVWTEENTGMGRARVMSIDQAIFGSDVGAINEGKVYLGTHGRGVFETDQLVSIEKNTFEGGAKQLKNQLKVYPNPVQDNVSIELNVTSTDVVNVQVFTITGQLVREEQLGNVKNGRNTVTMNLSDLNNGTYIIRAIQRGTATTAKFIKQ